MSRNHSDAGTNVPVCRHLPLLATPAEGEARDAIARKRVEALFQIVDLRSGDVCVERLDGARGAVHDGGARVDDGVEVARDGLRPDSRGRAGELPVCLRVDVVEFDAPGVVVAIGAAEVERGAGRGEFEGELVRGDGTLAIGRDEEGVLDMHHYGSVRGSLDVYSALAYLVKAGDGGVSHTEDPVNRVESKFVRKRCDSSKILVRDFNPSDGD